MDSRIREALEQGIAIQKKNYGNATELHLDMMDWVKVAQDALLTAEPEPCEGARQAFEQWAVSKGYSIDGSPIYSDWDTRRNWDGWEAAAVYASHLAQEPRDDERRRCIEAIKKLQEALCSFVDDDASCCEDSRHSADGEELLECEESGKPREAWCPVCYTRAVLGETEELIKELESNG